MRTFIKIGAVITAAAVVVIVAATIFARILITPERVRAAVLPVVEKALHREVQLGDISIHLFSGIILHDLRIMERDSDEIFISASSAALHYRLLPLLSLKVVIDELRLEEPHIRVVRLPGGTFNFSDLTAAADTDAGKNTPDTRADTVAKSGALPINVTIATVSLNSGTMLLIDTTVNPDIPAQYQINKLNALARSISLDNSFPFKLSCRIDDASLSIDGHADILKQDMRAHIAIDNFDATAFLPYFTDQIPGRLTGLNVALNANVTGNLNQISSKGTLALRDINLTLDDLAEAPIRDADVLVDFDVSADLTASLLEIRSSRINYNGIIAETSGTVEQLNTKPRLALDLKLPDLKISTVLSALPEKLVADILALNPSGVLDIQARIDGYADQGAAVIKNADVRLQNIQATAGDIRPNLNGSLLLAGDRLTSQNLIINAAGSQASIDLSANNLFDKPIITQHISAERFDLDTLFKPSAPHAGSADKPAQNNAPTRADAAQSTQEIGPFDLPLRANGTVKIGEAVFKGLAIKDFNLIYHLADNILTVEKMSGKTAGGTFSQSARIDLGRTGIPYTSTLTVQDLQLDPVVSAFIPTAAKTVFGNLNATAVIDGRGTLPETVKQNLTSNLKINLDNGRISGSKFSQNLADFLNINELRDLRFNTFNGTVAIKQGRAQLDTQLDAANIRMSPQGTLGLDGSLDLNLNTVLGPALLAKLDKRGKFMSYLTDKDGWGKLPLMIQGSLAQPTFSLHAAEMLKQTEQTVLETLQNKLLEKIQEKQQDSDNQTEEQKEAKKQRKKEQKKARKERKAAKNKEP